MGFREKFESLKHASDSYFRTHYDSEEDESKENVRIKNGLINLLHEASKEDGLLGERSEVISFLCDVCGHSGDLEIIQSRSPDAITPDELEFIIQNSALSRWF